MPTCESDLFRLRQDARECIKKLSLRERKITELLYRIPRSEKETFDIYSHSNFFPLRTRSQPASQQKRTGFTNNLRHTIYSAREKTNSICLRHEKHIVRFENLDMSLYTPRK